MSYRNNYIRRIKNNLLKAHILDYLDSSLISCHNPYLNHYFLTELMILSHELCVYPFETDRVKHNPDLRHINTFSICEPCYILTALHLATVVKISLQWYVSYAIVKITPLGRLFVKHATNIQKFSKKAFDSWHRTNHLAPLTSLNRPLSKLDIDKAYDYQRYGMPCLTDKLDLVAHDHCHDITKFMFIRFMIEHLDSYTYLFDASHQIPLKHLLNDYVFNKLDDSLFECR